MASCSQRVAEDHSRGSWPSASGGSEAIGRGRRKVPGVCALALGGNPFPRRRLNGGPRLGAGVQQRSSALFVCAELCPMGGLRGRWDGNNQAEFSGAKWPLTDSYNCSVDQAGFSGDKEAAARNCGNGKWAGDNRGAQKPKRFDSDSQRLVKLATMSERNSDTATVQNRPAQ
ncbi:hypothetical protein SKAU_G00243170 [Synaphobranchus kaupii]|uniref:Uncharacterized protein n=1 Tax=Synaphobranchus kaupii TaxID=118154 RepID=A0A9Q1IUJ6_SYNKA|nr:hypothetical protein SKAU_G00243170 [Synaphobranchus kaupii]